MTRRTVLYVVHNHPTVMPGGAETYAVELHEAMRRSTAYEPVLLARTGPPIASFGRPHEGTLLSPVGANTDEYFFHTDIQDYDWFLSTSRNKEVYTRFYRQLLEAYRPDVVHFQHTLFHGYDILRETRNTLPDAAIVYTLHEYLPICHRDGQMVRASGERCLEASPRRCHECFPEIPPQSFFLRERFIKSHLAVVDRFVAPSRFLVDRYVDWGIERERITYEPNGRRPVAAAPEPVREPRRRNRVAYFGQFTAFKGADVVLRAMEQLATRGAAPRADEDAPREPIARLTLHGANLEHSPEQFQARFRGLLEDSGDEVTLAGRYRPEDLPRLMAQVDWVVVPSVWWENAPLVIQEAFAHGRPVICSDIGGMAEMVTDGVDGLHFRAADPESLAEVIERAVTTPGLWDELHAGIRPVHTLAEHVGFFEQLYDELLLERRHVAATRGPRVAVQDERSIARGA